MESDEEFKDEIIDVRSSITITEAINVLKKAEGRPIITYAPRRPKGGHLYLFQPLNQEQQGT